MFVCVCSGTCLCLLGYLVDALICVLCAHMLGILIYDSGKFMQAF